MKKSDVAILFREYRSHRAKLKRLQSITAELTDRERQVLERLMDGKLNKQIASELSVSVRTVENARSRILRQFNVDHIAQVTTIETETQVLRRVVEPMESVFANYVSVAAIQA